MLLRTARISLERNTGSGHVELQDVAPGISLRAKRNSRHVVASLVDSSVHALQLEETGQLPLASQVSLNWDGLPLQALT